MEEIQPKWIERLGIYKNAIGRLAEVIELSKQRFLNQFINTFYPLFIELLNKMSDIKEKL